MGFKTFVFTVVVLGLGLSSCAGVTLRPDWAESPTSSRISRLRLELSGCGVDSSVGMLGCRVQDEAFAITEFPGDVIYFSTSTDGRCALQRETRATLPRTRIELPQITEGSCPVTVYYLPDYPAPQSPLAIYGLIGEIQVESNPAFTSLPAYRLPTTETLEIKFPGAQSGRFIGRGMQEPVGWQGDTLRYRRTQVGTDQLQVRTFQDAVSALHTVPVNWYAPDALSVLVDVVEESGPHWKPRKRLRLRFPESVSVVTIQNAPMQRLNPTLPIDFTGIVRGYTVKGRTVVLTFVEGVLQSTQ